MREPIVMCFSGGKDSSLALQAIKHDHQYDVVALLTTVTSEYERVSMHGVHRALLREQAASIGIPLTEVDVPPASSNDVYEREMGKAFGRLRADGIRRVAFGDIFLEDLRAYRERQLAKCGLSCLFPIWKGDTTALARAFIRDGFRAVVVCVDPRVLDPSFAGRAFDETFLADLPAGVDPCGENGEFHTCVCDGPIFNVPIPMSTGTVVKRDGFVYCDLIPQAAGDLRRRSPKTGVTP